MDDTALGLELQIRGLGIRSAAILLPNNNRSSIARIDADIQHVVAAFVDGAVELYKRRNKRVPACKMPPEVLETVFRQLDLFDRVAVTGVCVFWRYVAVNDAHMWSELSFCFKAPRRGLFDTTERVRRLTAAMTGFATLAGRSAALGIPLSVSITLEIPPPPPSDLESHGEGAPSFWDQLLGNVAGRVQALELKLAGYEWMMDWALPPMPALSQLVIVQPVFFDPEVLEQVATGVLATLPTTPTLEIDTIFFLGWLRFPIGKRNKLTLRNVVLSHLELASEALQNLHTLELLDWRSATQLAYLLSETPNLDTLRMRLRRAGSWSWAPIQKRSPLQTVDISLPEGYLPTATMTEIFNALDYTHCRSFSLAFHHSQPTFELFADMQAHEVILTLSDSTTICGVVRDSLGFARTVTFQRNGPQATQSESLTKFWAAFPLDRVREITIAGQLWSASSPIANAATLNELTLVVGADIPRNNWSSEARLPTTLRTFRLLARDNYQGDEPAWRLKYLLADILAHRLGELVIEGFEASESWNPLDGIAEKLVAA